MCAGACRRPKEEEAMNSERLDTGTSPVATAERFIWPLCAAATLALLLTLSTAIAWGPAGRAVVAPLAVYGLILTVVFATTAWLVHLRRQVFQAANQPRRDRAAADTSTRAEGMPAESPGPDLGVEAALAWFARLGIAWTFGLGGALGLAVSGTALATGLAAAAPSSARAALIEAGLLGLLALGFRAAAHGIAQLDARHLPEAKPSV
jgi:hypothetical protein